MAAKDWMLISHQIFAWTHICWCLAFLKHIFTVVKKQQQKKFIKFRGNLFNCFVLSCWQTNQPTKGENLLVEQEWKRMDFID